MAPTSSTTTASTGSSASYPSYGSSTAATESPSTSPGPGPPSTSRGHSRDRDACPGPRGDSRRSRRSAARRRRRDLGRHHPGGGGHRPRPREPARAHRISGEGVVIYVYGVGEHDGRLTAYVKRGVSCAPEPEPAALLDHDRVVYSLMERGPVLPMRFGTVLEDENAVRSLLLTRRKELRDMLVRVRGRVVFGVRGEQPKATSGRDYLNAKLETRRSLAPLAELAVDTRVRRKDTAYLVDSDLAAAFRERARSLKLALSGPWPPYSFTGALDG